MNITLTLQVYFMEWRLSRFGKELFIYAYTQNYVISNIQQTSFFSKRVLFSPPSEWQAIKLNVSSIGALKNN